MHLLYIVKDLLRALFAALQGRRIIRISGCRATRILKKLTFFLPSPAEAIQAATGGSSFSPYESSRSAEIAPHPQSTPPLHQQQACR